MGVCRTKMISNRQNRKKIGINLEISINQLSIYYNKPIVLYKTIVQNFNGHANLPVIHFPNFVVQFTKMKKPKLKTYF